MSAKLGRDVFLALGAVAWADGEIDPEEADAIVRTAAEEGLEIEEIADIERAMKERVAIESLDLAAMSKADRLFVYAVASWMTRVDGKVSVEELEALDTLGALLKVPPKPREHADAIAREIAEGGEGVSVARYDLAALRRTIAERLAQAQAARAALE